MTQPDFTRQQAAELLNVSLSTLDRMIAGGVLRAYKTGGTRRNTVRIVRESVDELRKGNLSNLNGTDYADASHGA